MKYSLLYTIALTLLSSAIIECSSNDQIESKAPMKSVEIGPIKFETFYNETNFKDKLKLSKSYFKFKIADKFSPDNVYLSMKLTRREELVRCDNLTLKLDEISELIDCQPIETHLIRDNKLPPSTTGGSGGGYIRRSSVRLKLPKPLPSLIGEQYLYPLKRDLIDQTIDNLTEEHNLTSLDFTDLKVNLGYYFEANIKLNKEDEGPICYGKVFLSINRTEILTRYSNDSYPEFMDEMQHFLDQGSKNGYMLSLQGVWCIYWSRSLVFAPKGSFTIIQRLKFPYLTVRHTIQSDPFNWVIDYTGQVNQTLVPEKGPLAYNTNVEIRSRSEMFDFLKFDLTQEILNDDFETGIEKMMLILKKIAIGVDAAWKGDDFYKVIKLYLIQLIHDSSEVGVSVMREAVRLSYSDDPDNEEIAATVSVKRTFLGPIDRFMESFIGSASKVEEQLKMNDDLTANNEIRDEF